MESLTELQSKSLKPLEDYEIIWLQDGTGVFEVDFKAYLFKGEELLFLAPGQYFRLLEGELAVRRIVPGLFLETAGRNMDRSLLNRVLFSHVIAVGSIQVTPSLAKLLSQITLTTAVTGNEPAAQKMEELLRLSVNTWLQQRPFDREISDQEIDLIFDLKHLIDKHFWERSGLGYYNEQLDVAPHRLNMITKSRLDRTPGELERNRLLLEAQRELVFTSKPAKVITYDLGFSDPGYFSRFFKKETGFTAGDFRERYRNYKSEVFVNNLLELIDCHYREQKSVAFYAERLNLTPKSLSAKVREALGTNTSALIQSKVLAEARKLLSGTDMRVSEIAWRLGFADQAHFSHFFRDQAGYYPTDFRRTSA